MANNKVGRDAAVLTASKVITLLVSLISAMLLSRFRTLDEYGTYSQLIILNSLFSAIFSLGLPNSTNYFLARAESAEERKNFLSVFYTLCTCIGIVIGIMLIVTVPLSSAYFKNPEISNYQFFLAVFPWTSVIIGTVSNVLVVYKKFKKLLLLNFANSLISLTAISVVQLFGWTFKEYILLYLCGECCIAVCVYIIVFRLEGHLKPSLNSSTVKMLLQYSIPLGLASLVGTVNIVIDKLLIGRLFETEDLAIYTNAAKELPLTIVAASFTAVLLPRLAKLLNDGKAAEAIRLWGQSIKLSYIIICFCAMACIAFAPQIISILYSQKYLPGVPVFRVYSLVLLLRVTYFGLVLNSVGKTKFIFYCSLASMGINAALNYLMYLLLGFIGPAVASFMSICIVDVLQLMYTGKQLNIKFRNIFPWKSLLKITVINLVLGVTDYILLTVLKIGTDAKNVAVAIAIGAVTALVYFICVRKEAFGTWRKLNEYE